MQASDGHLSGLSARQVLCLMAVACLSWVLVSSLSSSNLDSYNDMLENYAWSQPLLLGTHKHPPFFAWVVGLWFAVFPQTDWAYRLLSYTNVLVGLLGVWSLGRRLGLGALASWGALLLLWSFPYTTLAGKFNANSQLLSLWPWAAALLLASWKETGWRGAWYSIWLGLVAAACMLSKYYSGVFLAGFLFPIFLNAQGRRWMLTLRPYLALLAFALALWPHLAWVASHDWAPFGYAMDQGGGEVAWRYIARFALSPVFYWLPAWLACCLSYAFIHTRLTGLGRWHTACSFLLRSWQPQGWGDVLFWLAFMPWGMTLMFGAAGVVELSTPWAIPIGYAFALLWLRNLNALSPQASALVQSRLRKAWWVVAAAVLGLGLLMTAAQALKGDKGYYRPTREAAQALVHAWESRHPGKELAWVGGDWAENAMLAFYAKPGLRTVPGTPDSFPAQIMGLNHWQEQEGVLLCPLGPAGSSSPTACQVQARQWLQSRGLPVQPHSLSIERKGWRYPKPQLFAYEIFDVPAGLAH